MDAAPWMLVTYAGPDGEPRTGILTGGTVRRPPDALAALGLLEILDDWDAHRAALAEMGVPRPSGPVAPDFFFNQGRRHAAASRLVTLEPGDVLATGTPAGVGFPRQDFLAPGDEVVAQIDGLGALRNPVTER